jgi:hypothetical protein
MTPPSPHQAEPFRYWDYPEPGPIALAMLAPGPRRARLQRLLEARDAAAIHEWLDEADIADAVKEVVRRGLRGEEIYDAVYDAVEVASLRWDDRCGTVTSCVVRREPGWLLYEVWQDGELIGEFETMEELTGPEIRNLMVKSDINDEDYKGLAAFVTASAFHDDLEDFPGWQDEPDLQSVLEDGVIEGREFAGHDFTGANLPHLRAVRADLEAACFYRACLVGADFQSARLRHADLRQAELRHAFLQGADLEEAQLQGADLRHANLEFACLRNANLQGADLRDASLRHADLSGCRF